MMTRAHIVILRSMAHIVPEGERGEWLAEWMTELWYAVHEGRRPGVTGFCLGAFHDARWKRRNAPAMGRLLPLDTPPAIPDLPIFRSTPLLASPLRCLSAISLLGAVAVLVGWASPVPLRSAGGMTLGLFAFCAVYWPLALVAEGSLPGEYPRHRNWLWRGSFFVAKLILLVVAIGFGASVISIFPLRIDCALFCAACAVRWVMVDQRRRCPDCLHILDNPVRMGNHSRILLEWSGTELLCMRGHGVMHVPEAPAIWFRRQRWLPLV